MIRVECGRCGEMVFHEDMKIVCGNYVCKRCYSELIESISAELSSILHGLTNAYLRLSNLYDLLPILDTKAGLKLDVKTRLREAISDTKKQLAEMHADLWNYAVRERWEKDSR